MADIKIEAVNEWYAGDGDTYTLANDVGDTSKAFFRMLGGGSRGSGSGPNGFTNNPWPGASTIGIELTSTNQLTARGFYAKPSQYAEQHVIGEVWRYTGPAGGEHEFIVRWHGAVYVNSAASSGSQAVTGIVDEDRCVPVVCGVHSQEGAVTNWRSAIFGVHMDGAGNVVVSRNNTLAVQNAWVYVAVVEFTGSAWRVGHGRSANHDTAMENITLNTDSTGLGGSTFDVVDWGTALILQTNMEGDSGETGIADTFALAYPTTGSTTQVTFGCTEADAGARNDGVGWVHVIQNDALDVHRRDGSCTTADGIWQAIPWVFGTPTTVPTDEFAWEWHTSSSGTGTAHSRGALGPKLISVDPGSAEAWMHRSGNSISLRYGTVDLSGLVDSGGPVWDGSYLRLGASKYRVRMADGKKASIRLASGARL